MFVVLWFVTGYYHRGLLGIDLEQFLRAARSITDGDSPYPAFRYPPLPGFAMVPLSLLPAPNVVFTVDSDRVRSGGALAVRCA